MTSLFPTAESLRYVLSYIVPSRLPEDVDVVRRWAAVSHAFGVPITEIVDFSHWVLPAERITGGHIKQMYNLPLKNSGHIRVHISKSLEAAEVSDWLFRSLHVSVNRSGIASLPLLLGCFPILEILKIDYLTNDDDEIKSKDVHQRPILKNLRRLEIHGLRDKVSLPLMAPRMRDVVLSIAYPHNCTIQELVRELLECVERFTDLKSFYISAEDNLTSVGFSSCQKLPSGFFFMPLIKLRCPSSFMEGVKSCDLFCLEELNVDIGTGQTIEFQVPKAVSKLRLSGGTTDSLLNYLQSIGDDTRDRITDLSLITNEVLGIDIMTTQDLFKCMSICHNVKSLEVGPVSPTRATRTIRSNLPTAKLEEIRIVGLQPKSRNSVRQAVCLLNMLESFYEHVPRLKSVGYSCVEHNQGRQMPREMWEIAVETMKANTEDVRSLPKFRCNTQLMTTFI